MRGTSSIQSLLVLRAMHAEAESDMCSSKTFFRQDMQSAESKAYPLSFSLPTQVFSFLLKTHAENTC